MKIKRPKRSRFMTLMSLILIAFIIVAIGSITIENEIDNDYFQSEN